MQLRPPQQTRKIKRPEPPRKQSNGWLKFLAKGDVLFKYMTTHFNEMIDGDTIRQFAIGKGILWDESDKIDEIKQAHGTDIQKVLVQWIKNEGDTIFQPSMWKPMRDQYHLVDMFLGYRKMFQYKQYYFQLMVDHYYNSEAHEDETIFFGAALYGWKEETSGKLEPTNLFKLSDSYLIPDYYWNNDN